MYSYKDVSLKALSAAVSSDKIIYFASGKGINKSLFEGEKVEFISKNSAKLVYEKI